MDQRADPPVAAPAERPPTPASPPDLGGEAFRWRHLVSATPALVWMLTATHLLLLLFYSVAVPVYRAPDEPAHVDLVLALQDGHGWPSPGERFFSAEVSASMLHSRLSLTGAPADIDLRALEAHDATPRPARPAFHELSDDGPTPWHNQLSQHPPLFYVATHTAVLWVTAFTPDVHWSYDRIVGLLRLVNVALIAGLPLAVYAVARRLRASLPVATAAAVVPLCLPMLTHVGSTVNNDNLLAALFAGLFVVLTYVATGDTSRRAAVWVGVLGSLALLTKGFALLVPVWAAAAYGLALVRRPGPRRPVLIAGAVALATLGGGAWWWVRNVVVHGTVQPWGGGPFTPPVRAAVATEMPFLQELARLPERFWGAFGWVQVVLPPAVTAVASLAVVAGVAASLTLHRRRAHRPRADVAVLLLPVLFVAGMVIGFAGTGLTSSGLVHGIQGRYLLTGVVGFAVAAVLGGERLPPRARAWLPVALLVAAGVMQAIGVLVVLGHFWGGLDLVANARAMVNWAPWPHAVVLGLAGALPVTAMATAAVAVRQAALTPP